MSLISLLKFSVTSDTFYSVKKKEKRNSQDGSIREVEWPFFSEYIRFETILSVTEVYTKLNSRNQTKVVLLDYDKVESQ